MIWNDAFGDLALGAKAINQICDELRSNPS
jgi:hypothetical protein